MKKRIIVIIIFIMLLLVTGCGGTKGNGSNVKNVESKTSNGITRASVPETVILDRDGIKVTVKEMVYKSWEVDIKVLIENNSSQNITVQARKFSINGIMIEPTFSADVASGKKANDSISIYNSDLKVANITTIKDIEFGLHVFDADSWDEMFDQNGIVLTTNATDYVQTYNTSGTLVVDQNDIKKYVLKMDDKDSFWGADIYVYIENNSSQNITVQARDVSIDGFMVEPSFSADVEAGKKSYDTITFMESDLEDNGITDIKQIELKFTVFNEDTWNDIFDTDIKTINFN